MKKKVLKIMIFVFAVSLLTACGKKTEKFDIEVKQGAITVTCKSGDFGDEQIKMVSTAVANFDKDQNIMNIKITTIETDSDKDIFKSRLKMYKNSYEQMENTENEIYKYQANKKDNSFTILTVFNNLDKAELTEVDKEKYNLANYIKDYEDALYECTVKGITKEEINNN